MLTRNTDIALLVAYCLAVLGGILPLLFRRHVKVRSICVVFMIIAAFYAVGRVYVSPRMAVDRLDRQHETWTESFRDGSLYTWRAASTAIPVFVLVIIGLATMAVFPPKPR